MSSVSAQKKNPAKRGAKKQTLSTSQARANFADALGMAQEQSTVIGFDRYGKLIAAVVPIDAVRMLAGRENEVEPAVRARIERMARTMLLAAPARAPAGGPADERAAPEPKAKEKRKRRKDKREKKRKRAKAESGKRARRVVRKI